MSIEVKLVSSIKVNNTLGEGIQWNAQRSELWWTDIGQKQLFCYDWISKKLIRYNTPHAVCSFAFMENSEYLLTAFATGIAYFKPATNEVNWIHKDICDGITQRLNDGRVDRQGRFWVGSMMLQNVDAEHPARGNLYCLDTNKQLSMHDSEIHIANGTCWSPDSEYMYFSDSPRREIYRYAFNAATGKNTDRQLFCTTPLGAYPDGACVDAEGFLWSAHWGAGKVVRYKPDGSVSSEINIPASQPTCVAFGGDQLDLLIVSSARQDLSKNKLEKEPQAGNVFIYQTSVTGLKECTFKSEHPVPA